MMETEFDKINEKVDRLLDITTDLAQKVNVLERGSRPPEKDYVLKSYSFDEKRAQKIMRNIMKTLIETNSRELVYDMVGHFKYGTFGGILRRFIEQMFAGGEYCCLYIKGTRFYAYTNGGWVLWQKEDKDFLRGKFWIHCKKWVDVYTNNYHHITMVPNWGVKMDTATSVGMVTKREYVLNVICVNSGMNRSNPVISNTTMVGYLLKNSKTMAINRKKFKV